MRSPHPAPCIPHSTPRARGAVPGARGKERALHRVNQNQPSGIRGETTRTPAEETNSGRGKRSKETSEAETRPHAPCLLQRTPQIGVPSAPSLRSGGGSGRHPTSRPESESERLQTPEGTGAAARPGNRPSSPQLAFAVQCGPERMENHTEHPQRANASGLGTMPRSPLAVQAVTLTLVPFVCAMGVAGNAMVVLVVLRSRHMVTPTNCYLVSLAAADLLVLLAAGVPTVAEAASARVWVFGHAGCLGITYLQYVGINASTGSITAFTVERYLAICHPLRAQTLCTVARAKRIAASVWLGTGAYCVLWLFLVDTRETAYADGVQVQCGYRVSRSLYLPIYFLDFALFYALPLGLATVFYVLIARVLFVGPLSPEDPGHSGSAPQGHLAGHQRFSSRGKRGALSSRKQVTKMLAVVVLVFALLWLPYRTLVVVNSFLSPPYLNLGFLLFCRLCVYLNSAVNPVIYALMSQRFREAFHGLFQCRRAPPQLPPQEAASVYYSVIKDSSQIRLSS
ncbi:thyrotropin-releasing hormone receptor-like isoform X3 [Canis lupus familiaris]|uniref:thyrotropin-releasing hormone receptor-like isoform X3 n=1 Tax=Canis lupus familiaris TaxID=9615 RepID=UPI0018F4B0F1|nr:thyrotropin-releasing hormone receptor-like isoform X3 [Canis lupus familiaris]